MVYLAINTAINIKYKKVNIIEKTVMKSYPERFYN
jgi:hypothetical protein